VASKAFVIICVVELGKPYMLPEYPGRNSVRSNNGIEGRGGGKKRMTACNEAYRGSKFALTRKGADLPEVFRCMNGGKPTNVSSSITPKTGERLTDAQMSVNGLQTRITKAVIEMRTAARYRKGCEMLERYEGKLSRTVLRRGGVSNRFLLSLLYNHSVDKEKLHSRQEIELRWRLSRMSNRRQQ
jgi:hypothetical protein